MKIKPATVLFAAAGLLGALWLYQRAKGKEGPVAAEPVNVDPYTPPPLPEPGTPTQLLRPGWTDPLAKIKSLKLF